MCLRHAAYSVVAQIGHDSVAVAPPPFPPPPQLSHFRKIGPEKFWTNQSGCGLPTASASPRPGSATFQFFQPRYLALTFWREGFCATELFTGFLYPTTTVHSECVQRRAKIWAEIFSSNGTAAAADLNACSVNPGFHFFPLHRFSIFDTARH